MVVRMERAKNPRWNSPRIAIRPLARPQGAELKIPVVILCVNRRFGKGQSVIKPSSRIVSQFHPVAKELPESALFPVERNGRRRESAYRIPTPARQIPRNIRQSGREWLDDSLPAQKLVEQAVNRHIELLR